MKTLVTLSAVLFSASVLILATPANAAGDCPFGSMTKSVQSSSPLIAESPTPQTPKPTSGG